MNLKEYLYKEKMSVDEFVKKLNGKVNRTSMYFYLRGGKAHARSARIIEEGTNGEVTYQEMIKTASTDKL